jgi:membrane-associated phospholipid phosphatase
VITSRRGKSEDALLKRLLLSAALLTAPAARAADAPAQAPSQAPTHANLEYAKTAARDAGSIASSPLRWEKSDWLEAGAVAGTAVGLYAAADPWARDAFGRGHGRVADRFAILGRTFGDGFYTVPLLAAAYGAGEYRHDRRLRRASLDAVEALAISGLFVTGIKMTAGRARPFYGRGRGDWTGPSSDNAHYSFPSGHTSDAFAVATVLATEYADVPGLAPAAYGLAILTGLSRVYHDQHWTSDAFVGGALGYFTAKAVTRRHRDPDGRWAVVPVLLEKGGGLSVALRFE